MIAALRNAVDRFLGQGAHSLALPPLDGALRPNNLLDRAVVLAEYAAPDGLLLHDGALLFSSGNTILRLDLDTGSAPVEILRFASNITAFAHQDGVFAVGLANGTIAIRGGARDGLELRMLGQVATICVTALAFAPGGEVLACLGSEHFVVADWKRDLLERGHSGSVWSIDLAGAAQKCLASGLSWPNAIAPDGAGAVIVSESWRHRLIRLPADGGRPQELLSDLPAYPGRFSRAGDGWWLSCFAPRRQIVELVMREASYRDAMIAEVPPEHWLAPSLTPMRSYRDPLQGGALMKLAKLNAWAPYQSSGLVIRLDGAFEPLSSLHSRAGGSRHGITSCFEHEGSIFLTSVGSDSVVRFDPQGEQA
jgi:hypothetical protein